MNETRGGKPGKEVLSSGHTLSLDQLRSPVGHRQTGRGSLALASHRQCSRQPESHASGEARKSRRSSGLRPMACPPRLELQLA